MLSRLLLPVVALSIIAALPLRAAGPPVPEDVIFEKDIEYANPDNQHLQVDLAMPKKAEGTLPAIVCIHGGGFRAGKRTGYDKMVQTLAQHGYVAITVEYRLAPAYKFPAAVQDCKTAVRWLRANAAKYHVDPKRIGVMGGSAGGHLALYLGATAGRPEFEGEGNNDQSSAVSCVVSYYGPSDFTKSYGASVDAAEVLPLFLGGNLEEKHREHIIASPLYWVTPDAPPTLCIHGTDDKYVAYAQAQWMVDKLKASAVEAELMTIEGAGHGFKFDDKEKTKAANDKADAALLEFFDKHFKSAR